jgi:hypothetical protein
MMDMDNASTLTVFLNVMGVEQVSSFEPVVVIDPPGCSISPKGCGNNPIASRGARRASNVIPEVGTSLMLCLGLIGLGMVRKVRGKQ